MIPTLLIRENSSFPSGQIFLVSNLPSGCVEIEMEGESRAHERAPVGCDPRHRPPTTSLATDTFVSEGPPFTTSLP